MAAKKVTPAGTSTDERNVNLRVLSYTRAIEFACATRKADNPPTLHEVLLDAERIATFLISGGVDQTRTRN